MREVEGQEGEEGKENEGEEEERLPFGKPKTWFIPSVR